MSNVRKAIPAGYVELPWRPSYFLRFASIIPELKKFKYAAEVSHAQKTIDKLVEGKKIKVDLPRTSFKLREYDLCLRAGVAELEPGKIYLSEREGCLIYSVISPDGEVIIKDIETQIKAPQPLTLESLAPLKNEILGLIIEAGHGRESYQYSSNDIEVIEAKLADDSAVAGLNLTTTEVRALYAFACGDSDGQWLQGGQLAVGAYLLKTHWFLFSYDIILDGQDNPDKLVLRDQSQNLSIINTMNIRKYFGDEGMVSSAKDIVQYYGDYGLKESANGFTLMADEEEHQVLIEENFWRTVVLPKAHELLEKTDFNERDCFSLVPCLCDAAFARQFTEKLAALPQQKRDKVNKIVELYFEGPEPPKPNQMVVWWRSLSLTNRLAVLITAATGVGAIVIAAVLAVAQAIRAFMRPVSVKEGLNERPSTVSPALQRREQAENQLKQNQLLLDQYRASLTVNPGKLPDSSLLSVPQQPGSSVMSIEPIVASSMPASDGMLVSDAKGGKPILNGSTLFARTASDARKSIAPTLQPDEHQVAENSADDLTKLKN